MQEPLRDLRFSDLRFCYLTMGECTELGQSPEGWLRRLHDRLVEICGVQLTIMVEGDLDMVLGRRVAGMYDHVLSYGWPSGQSNRNAQAFLRLVTQLDDPSWPTWADLTGSHITRRRQDLALDQDWYNCDTYNTFYLMSNSDHATMTRIALPSNRHVLLQFWRERGEKPFSVRDTQRFHLISGELGSLIQSGRIMTPTTAMKAGLPPRMREVLRLIGRGLTEKEVADELTLSRHTVHDYIKTAHREFGVSTRGELVALSLRLLSPPDTGNLVSDSGAAIAHPDKQVSWSD